MADGREKKIVVQEDGPYQVLGGLALVRKTQVVSEYGEPLTWKKEQPIRTAETYELCRCGQSSTKPFCDGAHFQVGFDGAETADTGATVDRQRPIPGGVGIVVKRDDSLCMEAGFCGCQQTNVDKLVAETGDTLARSNVIAMIERCPSGAYTYALEAGGPDIEPDLPQQIATTTEITADGPIAGPLWVTGYIPVERADGKPFETRNRVTLCNCGLSKNKPLCDGAHRAAAAKTR